MKQINSHWIASDAGRLPQALENLLCPQSVSFRHSQPCPSSSQELLTQRSLLYNCASVLMNRRSRSHTLLPLCQSPPLLPPPSCIWQCSPSLFMSSYQRSHVRRHWGGKRGECLSERESQLQRASVCMCVWVCEIGGSRRGERRHTHTPADAATCTTAEATATLFTSEPSSVRLSWSSLLPLSWACLWALCVNGNAWKEMPAKEWLMRTSAPVWRVTPCVRTTTARGELDAWLFHDDYNGLQSVHFTEARGTLQAAVWDCTGERRHGRLWHQLCVCVVVYDSLCVLCGEHFQAAADAAAAACFWK